MKIKYSARAYIYVAMVLLVCMFVFELVFLPKKSKPEAVPQATTSAEENPSVVTVQQ